MDALPLRTNCDDLDSGVNQSTRHDSRIFRSGPQMTKPGITPGFFLS